VGAFEFFSIGQGGSTCRKKLKSSHILTLEVVVGGDNVQGSGTGAVGRSKTRWFGEGVDLCREVPFGGKVVSPRQ
jgi:hypothetical protein